MSDPTAAATPPDTPVNDAIRLYDVDGWGPKGFAIPYYPAECVATNNADIAELVDDIGKQLLNVMTRPDGMSSAPPTLPVLILVHKLVQRYRSVIAGEIVQSNEVPAGPVHGGADAIPFVIHPAPYFNMRNKWMKRWCGLVLQTISEMMQHQTNMFALGIRSSLIRDSRFGLDLVYAKLGTQFFGKDKTWAANPTNTLSDADFTGYNEDLVFTSTERIDRRAGLLTVYRDRDLAKLTDGIPASIALAVAKAWPFPYAENASSDTPVGTAAATGQPVTAQPAAAATSVQAKV